MTTLSTYEERRQAYINERLAILTTEYKGWKIIKRKTVVKPVNDCIQVMEYIIQDGDFKESTYTMETAKELIDLYSQAQE